LRPRHVQDVASVARANVDEYVVVARHPRGQPVGVDLSRGLTPYVFHVLLSRSLCSRRTTKEREAEARGRGNA
jgi:hypothetical protein